MNNSMLIKQVVGPILHGRWIWNPRETKQRVARRHQRMVPDGRALSNIQTYKLFEEMMIMMMSVIMAMYITRYIACCNCLNRVSATGHYERNRAIMRSS